MEVTQPSTVMGPPLPAELSLEVLWLEGDCCAKVANDNNRRQDSRYQVRIRSSVNDVWIIAFARLQIAEFTPRVCFGRSVHPIQKRFTGSVNGYYTAGT